MPNFISFAGVSEEADINLIVFLCLRLNRDETKERLEILNRSNDGFFIAGEDLRLRGPGDLFWNTSKRDS